MLVSTTYISMMLSQLYGMTYLEIGLQYIFSVSCEYLVLIKSLRDLFSKIHKIKIISIHIYNGYGI